MAIRLSLRSYLAPRGQTSTGLRQVLAQQRERTLRALLDNDRATSQVPWLGGHPVTVLDDGGIQEKATILILADGYSLAGQQAFATDVSTMINGLFAIDFYQQNRANFRVVRLGLVSADDAISEPNAAKDTALNLVYNDNWALGWFDAFSEDNYARIRKAVRTWNLDADITVVLTHRTGGNGLWRNRMMAITSGVAPDVMAHELGHCFGLLDEYLRSGYNETYAGGEPPAPNLTIETDRTKIKWRDLIKATTPIPTSPLPAGWNAVTDVGLIEGGWGRYTKGVYRPASQCRMDNNTPPFCPVCSGAVITALKSAIENQGRPPGGGEPGAAGESPFLRLTVRRGADGTLALVDVAPSGHDDLVPPPATGLNAHVVLDGDRPVAAAPMIEIPAHSFGADQPEPHGFVEAAGADEFEIRVPAAALAGIRPDVLRLGRTALTEPADGGSWVDAVRAEPAALEATDALDSSVLSRYAAAWLTR
ncbi:M64 family metallopeptidase [Microlunatus sp. GCM10028923]|uniref:M64 family metallopeptidase n=1 Tax=Microlunatus sp. GCM10028923 TaxID=3273400 RepID=UPI00360AD5A1